MNKKDLAQILKEIDKPKFPELKNGNSKTIQEFYDNFIASYIPDKQVAIEWHKTLMDYITRDNAVFPIRYYNSAKKDEYHKLRRGFYSVTNKKYSFFYTDNYHVAYYLKMMFDGIVVDSNDLLKTYMSKSFPSRFGRITSQEKQLMLISQGKDPKIQKNGFKIAHILNVGKDYYYNGNLLSLGDIVMEFFPGGERKDWENDKKIRKIDVDDEAKKYIIAEFLRFIHPFNHFLVPLKKNIYSKEFNDIGEYPPLINYVQKRFRELYGNYYEEFYRLCMPYNEKNYGKTIISLDYGYNAEKQNMSIDERIVVDYLTNPNSSMRTLEKQYLNKSNKGFSAMKIIHSYGLNKNTKGLLCKDNNLTFNDLLNIVDKKYHKSLNRMKKYL